MQLNENINKCFKLNNALQFKHLTIINFPISDAIHARLYSEHDFISMYLGFL